MSMRENVTLHAYPKGMALNTYEGKGDFAHLTDGMTLNSYGGRVTLLDYPK